MIFGILPNAGHLAAKFALVEGVDAVPPQDSNRQPPMASAMRWVSEITSGGMMLALPCLGGWWLDGRFKTSPWCLIAGGLLGLIASFLHILRITGVLKSPTERK